MKYSLNILIEAGEKTCASEPGKFCRFVGTWRMGSVAVCMLFPEPNPGYKESGMTALKESEKGWLLRCQACLDATQT